MHCKINYATMSATHKTAEGILADTDRQRWVRVFVKGAKSLVLLDGKT